MPWHPSFATNLPEQDAQHQYFVALLDQLDHACQHDNGDAIERLLTELERYATYHFSCEELLMSSYDYPAHKHVAEHRKLLEQLGEMRTKPDYSRARIRLFVFKWLTNHIHVIDKDFAKLVMDQRHSYVTEPLPASPDISAADLLTDIARR